MEKTKKIPKSFKERQNFVENWSNSVDYWIDNIANILKKWKKFVVLFWVLLLPILIAIYVTCQTSSGDKLPNKPVFHDDFGAKKFKKEESSSKEKYSWKDAKQLFLQQLESFSNEFPSQKRETWRQFKTTISKTLESKTPEYPAVITILIPPTVSLEFANCFTRKISSILNKVVRPVLQSKADISTPTWGPLTLTPATFKDLSITEIRAEFESHMQSEGKAFLVLDVDKFEREWDLLMLHGICDNYMAVDVRATVLFPVQVPPKIYENYRDWHHSNAGAIAYDVLSEAWEDVVASNVGPALIARVADAVILLEDGDECQIGEESESRYFGVKKYVIK